MSRARSRFPVLTRLNWGPKIVPLFPTVVHYKPKRNKRANLAITQLVYVQSALKSCTNWLHGITQSFIFSFNKKVTYILPQVLTYLLCCDKTQERFNTLQICSFRITLEHVKHILQIVLPIKKIAKQLYSNKQELNSAQREYIRGLECNKN